MSKIEKATLWMEKAANDPKHGYDQIWRWGQKGDYDCSAAVITAWESAGVPVKTKGATYTGNIKKVFLSCGFKDVTSSINRANGSGLKRGDVLLAEGHHVAMYCGGGKEVEASINEKGKATGGKPGDQTGREFLIRSYRNYPWTCILRFQEKTTATTPTSAPTTSTSTNKNKTVRVIAKSGLNVREAAGVEGRKLFTMPFNANCTWLEQKTKKVGTQTWYRVKYNNKKGWALGKWLQ